MQDLLLDPLRSRVGKEPFAIQPKKKKAPEAGASLKGWEKLVSFGCGRSRSRICGGRCALTLRLLLASFLDQRFARQPDFIPLDGQDLHQHLVAEFQFIAYVANAVFGYFADVQQAVRAWEQFHESAEFCQP